MKYSRGTVISCVVGVALSLAAASSAGEEDSRSNAAPKEEADRAHQSKKLSDEIGELKKTIGELKGERDEAKNVKTVLEGLSNTDRELRDIAATQGESLEKIAAQGQGCLSEAADLAMLGVAALALVVSVCAARSASAAAKAGKKAATAGENAAGAASSANEIAQATARASLFSDLRLAFRQVRSPLPRNLGGMTKQQITDGRHEEGVRSLVQHSFDEWFISQMLDEEVFGKLWEQYFQEAQQKVLVGDGVYEILKDMVDEGTLGRSPDADKAFLRLVESWRSGNTS